MGKTTYIKHISVERFLKKALVHAYPNPNHRLCHLERCIMSHCIHISECLALVWSNTQTPAAYPSTRPTVTNSEDGILTMIALVPSLNVHCRLLPIFLGCWLELKRRNIRVELSSVTNNEKESAHTPDLLSPNESVYRNTIPWGSFFGNTYQCFTLYTCPRVPVVCGAVHCTV
jgi:hypothetical protein